MREILFRGKRIDNGEWVYGHLVECEAREYRTFIVSSADWEQHDDGLELIATTAHEVDPETVGQYTGIKILSKRNKKVYAGDLFRNEDGSVFEVISEEKIGAFGAWSDDRNWQSMQKLVMWNELVGNRWDNPELLND